MLPPPQITWITSRHPKIHTFVDTAAQQADEARVCVCRNVNESVSLSVNILCTEKKQAE